MLYGLLQYAEVVLDTKEHIIIRFPSDRQFQYKNIKNGPMHDTFEQMVFFVSECNTKIDVEIDGEIPEKKTEDLAEKKTLNDGNISNNTENNEKKYVKASVVESVAIQKLREDMKENPFIKAAIRDLGSEIIKIEKD